MRRFFVPREAFDGARVRLTGAQARRAVKVLRLRPGDRVIVFDGLGPERIAEVEQATPEDVTARIVATQAAIRPPVHLVLLQGVPKGSKMDAVVRMSTELGVGEILPFHSTRTVAEGAQRTPRWRRIAEQSAQQCGRSDVPVVHDPMALAAALDRVAGYDAVLLLWEGERTQSIARILSAVGRPQRVAVVIGPEGGLAPAEVDLARARGAVPVTIGPLILRTETAGVVALAMVLYELTLRKPAG